MTKGIRMHRSRSAVNVLGSVLGITVVTWATALSGTIAAPPKPADVSFPPTLPEGRAVVTDRSERFLTPPTNLRPEVAIARTPPTIDFLYFPGQTYAGKPWSAWGNSLAVQGKYYASIGDHLAPAGTAFVYEYDPEAKRFRQLVDVKKLLQLPEGHYTPGKIHSRLDLGDDGWLYFSTHRGSTRVTTDKYYYQGDWIIRAQPSTGRSEVVARGPVPKHCLPASVLDPKRLIFYGTAAPGDRVDNQGLKFFAYDLKAHKLLYAGPDGPARCLIFASSTGRVYYTPGQADHPLTRFDPERGGPPVPIPGTIGIRAATRETPSGVVYTASPGNKAAEAVLYAFDTRTEKIRKLGPAAVGTQQYIAALEADPTGRYLYYVPGAHGGSDADGSPVVQFDVRTGKKKVLAFLATFYRQQYGCTPRGTYSLALDPRGDRLYITWNVNRSTGKAWDCCALTVLHIPESERQP